MPPITAVSTPVDKQTASSTHIAQKAVSVSDLNLGELENSGDNCGYVGVLHSNGHENCKDFIGENDIDSDEKTGPIPMSINSKELQQNDNMIKARRHSSGNSIILSVNALSRELEEKRKLSKDDDKADQ